MRNIDFQFIVSEIAEIWKTIALQRSQEYLFAILLYCLTSPIQKIITMYIKVYPNLTQSFARSQLTECENEFCIWIHAYKAQALLITLFVKGVLWNYFVIRFLEKLRWQ